MTRDRSIALRRGRRAAGFTLIEMLVTVSLIVVLLALAAPSFSAFQRNSELTTTANTMLSSLALARSEAMKRNRNAYVMPADGTSWNSGWVVFVDMDSSQSLDEAVDVVVSKEPALPTGVTAVTGSAPEGFQDGSGKLYVMFNGAGYPRLMSGAFQASSLDLTNGSETRRIISSPAGRLRVCKPADAGCSAATL